MENSSNGKPKNLCGAKIKQLREKQSITAAQLSERLSGALSEEEIAAIENGSRELCDIEILLICRALNITAKDLFSE